MMLREWVILGVAALFALAVLVATSGSDGPTRVQSLGATLAASCGDPIAAADGTPWCCCYREAGGACQSARNLAFGGCP